MTPSTLSEIVTADKSTCGSMVTSLWVTVRSESPSNTGAVLSYTTSTSWAAAFPEVSVTDNTAL